VADKLSELFKADRKSYGEKWADIGIFVKYGALSEPKFNEKAKDFVLLTNTKNEHYTLTEYKEKVAPLQTDKEGTVVYLYTPNADKHHSYIAAAEKRSYDVLLMNSPIDNHFISHLEQQLEKTALKRVDSDVMDKLIPKDEPIATVLTDEQVTKVKDIFTRAVTKPGMEVSVESLSPDELPVTVTMDEWMRRMKDMAAMGGGMSFYGSLPDRYKVAVNGNHPLILRMLESDNEEAQGRLARQAFDLALLSQGMLTGADLTEFVQRSVGMI
jgi:molecular chaperone HtpG